MTKFLVNKRWIPVTIARHGKKLAIQPARPVPELEDEFRSWVGGEFDRGLGCWIVTDCPRNQLQIQRLTGLDPWKHLRHLSEPATGGRAALRDHQRLLIGVGMDKRKNIWASEQGTGKTLAAIELIERVDQPTWWIGPARVLPDTKMQFERWGAQRHPDQWLSWHGQRGFLEKYRGPAPRVLIADECTIIKGCGPIYDALQHISRAMTEEHGDNCWKILMSGKPAPNEPTDWWAPAETLEPGLLRESTPADLRHRIAVIDNSEGFPVVKSWKEDEVERLGRRLAPICTVIRAADCLDLPPCEIEVIDLPIERDMLDAAKMIAASAGTGAQALNLLRQLSDGFQYGDGQTARCPTPKDDFLRAKLAQGEDDGRIAIYASYRESIDRCVEICHAEGWNVLRCDGRGYDPGPEPLREFDAATSSGLGRWAFVGHPRSGGFGLNLTAPRVQVLYSLDFDWGAYDQTIKRLHRLGQTRGVRIYVPSHLKTDKFVLKRLQEKGDLQNVTLDEIRRVLSDL